MIVGKCTAIVANKRKTNSLNDQISSIKIAVGTSFNPNVYLLPLYVQIVIRWMRGRNNEKRTTVG